MNNPISEILSQILVLSKEEANRLYNKEVNPEHILLGILRDSENAARNAICELHADPKLLKEALDRALRSDNEADHLPQEEILTSEATSRILKLSILEARELKSSEVGVEHVLLAILREKETIGCTLLNENNVTYEKVVNLFTAKKDIQSSFDFDEEDEVTEEPPENGGIGNNSASTKQTDKTKKRTNDTPVIDNFGTDLTKIAAEGKLDPVIGREKEIERIAQILSRRKKNNPILLGAPGVGKSAIVEGLALRIAQKKVSRTLFGKRVIALDIGSIVAGTKYRGQFEERLRSIINEIKENPNIILFIDEIHTIVGAGSASGSMDAANMLKPVLSRGEFQCIGATTTDEYRKTIEKDGALERRFQKIIVEQTSEEETLEILHNIKAKYEAHHNVNYTDEAIEACVKLTARYITDRSFPDKAIDALDEAGSHVHIVNIFAPKEIEEQEKAIVELQKKKSNAVEQQDFEQAAQLRDVESEMEKKLEVMKSEWESTMRENREIVDLSQVENVVSMMSGVPVQRMAKIESLRLKGMKQELMSKVISQDSAISKLVQAITRSRVGLKDPNRPIGTFMFIGSTGVGKTYLAKQLALSLFGSTDAMIRIDMSEYMEKYSVSRLVGAPPGYVGYDDGGQLTEKVRRHPYSILLLDEIEKAHTDVFNLLLQVMDEGRLTDSNGCTIDFKNTVIIMTSNSGTRQVKEYGNGIGFSNGIEVTNDSKIQESIIRKALNKQFAPEFLNRLDEIIMFDSLNREAIHKIAAIELVALSSRMQNMGYTINIDNDAINYLVDKGFDKQLGARPLKRAIQTYIEDPLCEMIVNETIGENNFISVSFNQEKKELVFS
ncbi:MAG: ATP-dependent Clp protease ATP-binding subunit [Bacteroidaceae bacterium]